MQHRMWQLAAAVVLSLAVSLTTPAQTITGSIVGSLADPSGLAIAGAEITLVQPATGAVRKTSTDERGDFQFPSLQPGSYDLTVTAPGFKSIQQNAIVLSAAEIRPVGRLVAEVGG